MLKDLLVILAFLAGGIAFAAVGVTVGFFGMYATLVAISAT